MAWEDLLLTWHGWVGGRRGGGGCERTLSVCRDTPLCAGAARESGSSARTVPSRSPAWDAPQSDDVMEGSGGSSVKGAEHFC